MTKKPARILFAVVVTMALVTGAAVAFAQVTRDVAASVNVELLAQDGIEIYLDPSDIPDQPASSVDFGVTTVDVFGTSSGVTGVPVWVKNHSLSRIKVSLGDDFAEADVMFEGSVQNPVLGPDDVWPGVLTLNFHQQGADGVQPFMVIVKAEGPVPSIPQGTLTALVPFVRHPNGLPSMCTAGCSEDIYLSDVTDTLFISKELPDGTVTTEPMLALDFTLDPSLDFGDFNLRQGVQFHNGWGEMTAKDVAFSYNDANAVTNPSSNHGQAGDFAPLIANMQELDTYTVRLNYRNYDSRGMLHRFSSFWQTAGIVSSEVFEVKGSDGMQSDLTGVGAFVVDEWDSSNGMFMHAFEDYWGKPHDLGPFVQNLRILPVGDSASRRAMLESGEAQIADIHYQDIPELEQAGFAIQKGGGFNTIDNISFTGNYWEDTSALTGDPLVRNRDISKPWVGDPFQNGPTYDENTASMVSSMKVRTALAFGIDRQTLLDDLLVGQGFINHQPYLSINNPNYRSEWSWGTDFDHARTLLTEAGYPTGFQMDFHVRDQPIFHETGEAIAATWLAELGVDANLIKAAYSTYRPGLVDRSTSTPAYAVCGDENKANFPYDWAHGFVVSSMSEGGYGVGQELPYASTSYIGMAGEPDKAAREVFAADFYANNKKFANCVGIFERPLWAVYDDNEIVEWDVRPNANGNLAVLNNFRSVKVR